MFLLFGFSGLGIFLLWLFGWVGWGFSLSLFNFIFVGNLVGVVFDDVSLVYGFMLFFCGSLALYYCFHYFGGSADSYFLFPLIVSFLGVMFFLVFSDGLVLTLVFWEYLGLVSFFLILFYSNGASVRASLVTLFASRFGDVSIFMLLVWFCCCWDLSGGLVLLFSLLVVLTKSASFPFVSWLLEAMRAPTPVSSLVHSSTLVAAGIWFLFRYDYFYSWFGVSVLFFFCLFTVLLSAVCAIYFSDLKKIVALSTCNNVSWCLLFFICGDFGLALLQLITHGVCKCYLFMSVGDLMGLSGGSQSAVGVYLSRYSGRYLVILQSFLIIALCGLPFLGVFFSKHGFFSLLLYTYGSFSLFFLFLGFLFSYIYSVRFVLLLCRSLGGLSSGYSSSFLLVSGVILLGTFLNYAGSGFFMEVIGLEVGGSLLLFFFQLLGCLLGALVFFWPLGRGSFFNSVVWCGDCLVNVFYDFFLSVSSVCMLSFYRWEVYILNLFPLAGLGRLGFSGFSLLSFNFMICGLFFVLLFCCFLGM